ncbi:MAG: flagellar hook protein FlgE [Pseudomonadota bacterium]
MSLFTTLNTGASGMGTQSSALSVIGDNIANLNTVGFKGSRASFADFMPQNTAGLAGPATIGCGAGLNTVATQFGQGSMSATSNATDMAISGAGFFMVTDGDQAYYTRAGEFYRDADGYLVTAAGYRLQGYNAEDGDLSHSLGDLMISTDAVPPSATTEVALTAVLNNETATSTTMTGLSFDGTTATGATWDDLPDGAYTTSVTVYDAQGGSHEVTIAFERTADDTWEWYALVDGSEVGQTEDYPVELASGSCTFDGDGVLTGFTGAAATLGYSWSNGASVDAIDFQFGLDGSGDETAGRLLMTEADSAVSALSQDGYPIGELSGVSVDVDGTISGTYTNGEEIILGQVALATFASVAGLDRVGGALFRATASSGDPALGAPGSGGRGDLYSYALESSNVELEDEFVAMITAQRGYQASARVISTADQTLQELVNLI